MIVETAARENPLFRGLSDADMDKILALAREKVVQGGDIVLRQFEGNADLIVILQGIAAVKTFTGEIVAEMGPGAVLGEVSLIDAAPRSATVFMRGDGRVAAISATAFKRLLDEDVALRARVMENIALILASRLRAANVHLDFAR